MKKHTPHFIRDKKAVPIKEELYQAYECELGRLEENYRNARAKAKVVLFKKLADLPAALDKDYIEQEIKRKGD